MRASKKELKAKKREKEIFQQRQDSNCKKYDDMPNHHWERRGVSTIFGGAHSFYVVWQCNICKKAILEPLEPLTLVDEKVKGEEPEK